MCKICMWQMHVLTTDYRWDVEVGTMGAFAAFTTFTSVCAQE